MEGARIIDLAPTLLNLLGVPVPADMDGSVLEDIFIERKEDRKSRQLAATIDQLSTVSPSATDRWSPTPDQSLDMGDGSYSAEDEEKIVDRLKALGYVE